MVQFKRKPVRFLEPSPFLREDTEVWGIEQTGEVFTDYESFLARRDFYNQKKFTCDITGHTGLTYFQALNSELHGSRDVETNFPENLREHVLRKVQFSQVSRLDDLVNEVYGHFKKDFFPGELIIAISDQGERIEGVIREKVSFPAAHDAEGRQVRPAISNYFVKLRSGAEAEAFFDDNHITRDRKIFSKNLLRSFLKHSITREAHHNAPWTVKEGIAKEYKIPTELPPHLQPQYLLEQKKLLAGHKKNGATLPGQPGGADLAMRPGPKGRAGKHAGQDAQSGRQEEVVEAPSFHGFSNWQPQATTLPPPDKPPPPKYPIEDLEVPPRENGPQRPALRFIARPRCQERKANGTNGLVNGHRVSDNELRMSSVGLLLETWNTLNVHEEVFLLDSFTWDDFLDAMRFMSDEVECELFTEIHCAVLKQLVSEEGKLLVDMPELEEEDDEEDEEDEEGDGEEGEGKSAEPSPSPEPELRRTTRGSLRKAEAEALKREKSPTPDPNQPLHRAAEMLDGESWIDRLKARDFRFGGWQLIVVGILQRLALDDRHRERCEPLLRQLAPLDMAANQETARVQYAWMEVDLKVEALQILCMLAVGTKAIREYLEQCSEDMTEMRKIKMEYQRARKPLIEELRELDEQRKAQIAEEAPPEPTTNGTAEGGVQQQIEQSVEIAEVADIIDHSSAESDDGEGSEDEVSTRALRRGQERKRKREEDAARKEKEAKAKAAQLKLSAKMRKILREIEKKKEKIKECEDKIAEQDSDLREANCQRTKLLGKDRFSNRYWWFEKNGMPFSGMPGSSSAHHGYANGRIWVQGPDDMEREGFLELRADEMAEYKRAFGVTMQERRDREEGAASQLAGAREWGFLDQPDSVDALIAWLDERGRREKDLRKELQVWRDTIMAYMARLQERLAATEAKRAENGGAEQATPRVSTRTKTYVDVDASKHQCLAWRNERALAELGHLHSEQPRPRNSRKKGVAEVKKVPVGKSGKPLTRQGVR